jgi:hypothetical protein
MTPQEAIVRIGQSTTRAGFATSDQVFLGMRVLVARTSQFRLRWMATKLHTFVVASAFPPGTATPDQLDDFMHAMMEYGRANKGGLPASSRTSIAAITVAVTESADRSAHAWTAERRGSQHAVQPFPVLVDVATGEVTHMARPLLGSFFYGYLKGIVEEHVTAAVGGWTANR